MKKPHKHADLIKAWADGAIIEALQHDGSWSVCNYPDWSESVTFRVVKERIVRWQWVTMYMSKFPQLSRCFYSESEAVNAFDRGVQVIGKAEWTRMEFDE